MANTKKHREQLEKAIAAGDPNAAKEYLRGIRNDAIDELWPRVLANHFDWCADPLEQAILKKSFRLGATWGIRYAQGDRPAERD